MEPDNHQQTPQPQQPPPCLYEVLGVAPGARPEDIKQAFRQAALRLHPDKAHAGGTNGTGSTGGASGGNSSGSHSIGGSTSSSEAAAADYLLVQQAWEVLQDAGRRAAYDRQLALAAAAAAVHINESVALADMAAAVVEGQRCRSWPCRCGGSYLLLEEDAVGAAAGDAEVAVPCSTCSLHIRVTC